MFRIFAAALAASFFAFGPAAYAEEVTEAQSFELAQADTGEDTQEATEETETAAEEDRTICRRVRVTGSLRSQRVCMTESQWTAESNRSRETIRDHNALEQNNTGTVGQQ